MPNLYVAEMSITDLQNSFLKAAIQWELEQLQSQQGNQ